MNQILKTNKKENTKKKTKYNSRNIYKFQFIISSFIAICCLIIFMMHIFKLKQNEKISKRLMDIYNISTLYSNNSNYSAEFTSNISKESSEEPFVVGIVKIDKISVNYPILSKSNKELLDISICRFAGPMPNEIGNFCIAGHNYVDYKFFSRLNELKENDIIKIYDLSGNMIEYSVYKIYETKPNNNSCTSQDTNGEKRITLLTCNNVSGKRLVVVAKEIKK